MRSLEYHIIHLHNSFLKANALLFVIITFTLLIQSINPTPMMFIIPDFRFLPYILEAMSISGEAVNLNTLRTFRVLRPLKLVSGVPSKSFNLTYKDIFNLWLGSPGLSPSDPTINNYLRATSVEILVVMVPVKIVK